MDYLVVLHIAGYDVEAIIGRIFFRVIIADVFRLKFVENIKIADDREAVGAFGVSGFKQPAAGAAAGVILAHVHLAADHIEFLGQVVRRQRGVLHDVAQYINSRDGAGVGHVNMINRAVEAGVGVHVAPGLLHFLINAAPGARGRAFKKHVFQNVRQPRAEPGALVDAARGAPGLRGDDRRVVIFAHDDRQSVFKCGEYDAGWNGRNFAVGN